MKPIMTKTAYSHEPSTHEKLLASTLGPPEVTPTLTDRWTRFHGNIDGICYGNAITTQAGLLSIIEFLDVQKSWGFVLDEEQERLRSHVRGFLKPCTYDELVWQYLPTSEGFIEGLIETFRCFDDGSLAIYSLHPFPDPMLCIDVHESGEMAFARAAVMEDGSLFCKERSEPFNFIADYYDVYLL